MARSGRADGSKRPAYTRHAAEASLRGDPSATLRDIQGGASAPAVAESFDSLIEAAQRAEVRGSRPEARALYERALSRLAEAGSGREASSVLRWIARTYRVDAELELALDCAAAALAIAEAHGDDAGIGHATNIQAVIHLQQGDLDGAERLYHLANASALRADDVKLSAMIAQNLGVIANIRGDLDTALRHYESSLAAYRRLGLAADVCVALNNLGLLHTQRRQWSDAQRSYDEATCVAEALGDPKSVVQIDVNRAECLVAQGHLAEARDACERASARAEQLDECAVTGQLHKAFGIVERELASHERAEHHLLRARTIAAERNDQLLLAESLKESAVLYRRQGRNRDTLQCLNQSHRLFAQMRARLELADVGERLEHLESDFLDVVRRWGESIESKDEYTQGHCERVADMACALARQTGMDEQSLFWFRIGALLHDVGKLVIPAEVLNKAGALSPEEWELVKHHPTAGVEMLKDVEFPWDVRPIVESHHERWDGRGYPHGLAGDAIPMVARILCIADVYDALTSRRSYKKPMTHAEAMNLMRFEAGKQFDPELFAMFEAVAPAAAPAEPMSAAAAGVEPEAAGRHDAAAMAPTRGASTAGSVRTGHLVGRDDARRALVEALDCAVRSDPRVVVLSGEAGIGKSALARELTEATHERDAALVWASCSELDALTPFRPWMTLLEAIHVMRLVPDRRWQALGSLLPALPGSSATSGRFDRSMLFGEVAAYLKAASRTRTLVIVVDDAQWADPQSAELLEHVVAAMQGERVLVCTAVRPEEMRRDTLDRRRRLARSERVQTITLRRLSETETAAMAEHILAHAPDPALAAHLFARTDGNPFLVAQFLEAMRQSDALSHTGTRWEWAGGITTPIPAPVHDIFARRLARLPLASRRILGRAAVMGPVLSIDTAIAAGVATEPELLDAIEDGMSFGILHAAAADHDDEVRFTHVLLAELLREEVHPRRTRRMHEAVAQRRDAASATSGQSHGALRLHPAVVRASKPSGAGTRRTGSS